MSIIDGHEIPKLVKLVLYGGIKKAVQEVKPFQLLIELNKGCKAGCSYCYASSNNFKEIMLKSEDVFRLIDEAWELGIRIIYWFGGDPLLHPNWYELLSYSIKKRMVSVIVLSGLISKKDAKRLTSLKMGLIVTLHIDTIDQKTYNLINKYPSTLKKRIAGCNNLLEAGFPRELIIGYLILCKPSIRGFKKTIDWFTNEIGTSYISCATYKDQKFVKKKMELEPSLSNKKKVVEYRDKKLGNFLSVMGSADIGSTFCRTLITVHADGIVSPCFFLYDLPMGHINQQSLKEIVDKNRDEILFNYEISGYCPKCKYYKSVCIGCRADAYHYTGDLRASDPKCFRNPDAKQYYFSK